MSERSAKQATSLRLRSDLLGALKRRAQETGIPASALYERFLEEGLRHDVHPLIVFREGAGGRRPTLVGTRLDVGHVIDTIAATDANGSAAIEEVAEYLGLPAGHVRACVSYYADYKDDVDAWRERMHLIAEREREAWTREQAVLA